MEYFKKLPKAWRDIIDQTIKEFDDNENKEAAAAFREMEAESLLECELGKPTKKDLQGEGTCYGNFVVGWKAALNWIRQHGEEIDCSAEDKEYPALIVKESDLKLASGSGLH